MVMFNAAVNNEVKKLRQLRKKIDKTEYLKLKKSTAKKYDVSERTVENWLKQRVPGLRKSRSDAGKVKVRAGAKEKKIAAELLATGKEIRDIKKIIENKTGKTMTKTKLKRVREKAEEINEKSTVEESSFGDEAKELFEKLFELDLIAPDAGVKIKIPGGKFLTVKKEYLEDICLILANAYNNALEVKYKLDRNEMLRMKILNLIEQQVRLAMQLSLIHI